ncbi:hypothetical protein DdX_09503 [Ditylenchus destructor]|uniref:Uncharacterized protein n=1 Tax=Ditylenchus destructor TaxID=166010 RepID=A0AAD4QZW8_9BILA|nr:hypothetical protein DdX_09503 [Ditylenchus destructor]
MGRTRPANQRARDARKKKRETRACQPAELARALGRTRLSLLLSCVPRSLIGWSCAPLLFHLTRNSNYGDSEQPWYRQRIGCRAPPQPRGSAAATGSAAGTGHAADTGPAAATGRAADTGKKYHTLHDPMSPYMTSRDVM